MIPLGAMEEENRLDILDAVDGWLHHIGGGFAIDSAERLLERLLNEHAASRSQKIFNCRSSYVDQSKTLTDVQRDILNSWIQTFRRSDGRSKLALSRAEHAMFRLLDSTPMIDKTTTTLVFPIEEYITIIEGYLQLDAYTQEGPTKASNLLLRLIASDSYKKDLNILDHSTQIVPLLESCLSQLLKTDPKGSLVEELLETTKVLEKSGIFPEINIPAVTEGIQVVETPLQQREQKTEKHAMSPFELEIAENRLLDVLKTGNEEEKDTVHDLVQKLSTPKPRNKFIVPLLGYYLKVGDSEAASYWLQELEPSVLVTSYDLVERVLETWSTQKGTRVPWRADEVFKAIARKIHLHDDKFLMSSKSLKLIVDIWTLSEDPAASRKIVDWYSQMISWRVKPDISTLKMTLQALRSAKIDKPLDLVSIELFQQWDNFTSEEKMEIANMFLELISFKQDSPNTILEFAERLLADNVVPVEDLFRSSISAIQTRNTSPSDVLSIVHSFDEAAKSVHLSFYTLAINILFKLNEDATPQIASLYDHVLKVMTANREIIDQNDFSEFLYGVIAMHVSRKQYSQAEGCLKKAETLLLSSTVTIGNQSPIPLKCYKKIILRNWYTAKTAQKVEESFANVTKLYRSGYSNLQPDSDLYSAYISARAVAGKEVENTLEEMIEQYKTSGNEESKPQAKVFNTILLSLSQDKRNASRLHSKSTNLLNRMADLGVQPNIKTINLILKNVIKGNYDDAYKTSTVLITMIDENKLNPDSHTLHFILDACGSASSGERFDAIKKCLSTLAEIRAQNFVGPITYGILSKVVYRLASRDARADKIGKSVLSLCCKDGMLTSEVRGRLQATMSRSAWEKEYTNNLTSGEREPIDWSRNIQTK